jgi:hypothetical protein
VCFGGGNVEEGCNSWVSEYPLLPLEGHRHVSVLFKCIALALWALLKSEVQHEILCTLSPGF